MARPDDEQKIPASDEASGSDDPRRDLDGRIRAALEAVRPTGQAQLDAQASGAKGGLGPGSDFAATIIGAGVLGWGLDLWLDSAPWGLIGLMCGGFLAGLVRISRALGAASEEKPSEPDEGQRHKQKE